MSVILLTFNHERYVAQAIESVLGQTTGADVELIISEDCSTDGTRAIVADYADRHPDRIQTLLSPHNLRSMEVYFRAYRAARGDLIAYLDGDDYWHPTKLERQIAALRAHPEASMCYHDVEVLGEDGHLGVREYGPYRGMAELLRGNHIPAASLVFRRAALGKLPPWLNHVPYLDWPLAVLLAQQGPPIYLEEKLSVYREHAGGYYSGASSVQQVRWDLTFLETIGPHLAPAYRPDHRRAVAATRLRLATAQLAAGDRTGAARQALHSLVEPRSYADLGARSRVQVVAKAAAPRSYDRARQLRDRLRGPRS